MPEPDAQANAWRVIGRSVRGASHVRSGLENQDAIGWLPEDGGPRVVMSVADGHGSAKSFRSATGARFAVAASNELAAELLTPGGSSELSWIKDRLEEDAPRRIVRQWRAMVDQDLESAPFTEGELDALREKDGQHALDLVEKDPYLAYGSTLVTAVATESFMAFWQIGDGDVVTVSVAGGASRPLPADERLIANETTSLCSADAWRLFRVGVFGTPVPVIMISTDGFANSFLDDDGFFQFGSDVLRMLAENGPDSVGDQLDGWLSQMTRQGSGDDISLAVACMPGALPDAVPAAADEDATGSVAASAEQHGGGPHSAAPHPAGPDQESAPQKRPIT